MAKVTVNKDKCIGCGVCQSSCPETFEIGDDGKSSIINAEGRCDFSQAAQDCPAGAIDVKE